MTRNIVMYIDAMIMPDKNAAAQRASAICKSLIDIGKKPVIVGLNTGLTSKSMILDSYENYYGIDCYAVKYPKSVKEWICRMITIKPFLEVIDKYGKDNINSIIAMDYEVIALYRLKKYCERNNIRIIADNVEWYGKSKLKFPMNVVKDLDTKIRMEYLYPKFDYMICISKYLYNNFKLTVPNIEEIPGTIDTRDEKWISIKKYVSNDVLTIGYAGNPGNQMEKERVDMLIRAVCILNENGIGCKLYLAGFNKDILDKYVLDLKEYSTYKKNVIYLGILTHLECLDMIARCDFSAIVREDKRVTRAGFPTKLSESFGCGTPVITTPSSNISDYVIDGINGFVTSSFSMDSLIETIRRAALIDHAGLIEMHTRTFEDNPLTFNKFNDSINRIINNK